MKIHIYSKGVMSVHRRTKMFIAGDAGVAITMLTGKELIDNLDIRALTMMGHECIIHPTQQEAEAAEASHE